MRPGLNQFVDRRTVYPLKDDTNALIPFDMAVGTGSGYSQIVRTAGIFQLECDACRRKVPVKQLEYTANTPGIDLGGTAIGNSK